jgi:hypothetical protein
VSPYRAAADVIDEDFLRRRKTDWPLVMLPWDATTLTGRNDSVWMWSIVTPIVVALSIIIAWL